MFLMNPPFSIGNQSGIDRFIRRCAELAEKWGKDAKIHCVSNQVPRHVWKLIWDLPANIEVVKAHLLNKQDERCRFMRVNTNANQYDPLNVDICVLEMRVHVMTVF